MDQWHLPTSLNIGGVDYAIRTDFRDILKVLRYFENDDYTDEEKWSICLRIIIKDWRTLPEENIEDAMKTVMEFIDCGNSDEDGNGRKQPKTMDWEQDARIIIPSINKVLGKEIRAVEYMHWWTFMGAYMEIGEGLFSQVVTIRQKKAKGEKLESWERKFYEDNRSLVDIKKRYTKEELEEQQRLKELLRS